MKQFYLELKRYYSKYIIRFWITAMLFSFNCFDVLSQASSPDGGVRLTFISGGNVPFVFNSIAKWENGVSYLDWTRFSISVTDSASGVTDLVNWSMTFKVRDDDGDALLTGDGGNTLNFNTIVLEPSIAGACGAVIVGGPTYFLTTVETEFVTGTIPLSGTCVNTVVGITYRCGTIPGTNTLIADQNAVADHYSDLIEFTLYGCFAGCP